jgi:hypothetical protein
MSGTPPRRCPGCGAEAPRTEARFCEHCGRALEAPAEEASPPSDPFGDVPARFRALAARAELPGLLAEAPYVPELAGRTLPSLLSLVGLGVVGAFAALVCFQICPPLGFVPLALVLLGVAAIARQLLWNARTPLVARPALVVDVRARVQAGAEHSREHTRHHATLQLEDGLRSEHECFVSVLPALAPGALGVAYLKGDRLAGFAPLDV